MTSELNLNWVYLFLSYALLCWEFPRHIQEYGYNFRIHSKIFSSCVLFSCYIVLKQFRRSLLEIPIVFWLNGVILVISLKSYWDNSEAPFLNAIVLIFSLAAGLMFQLNLVYSESLILPRLIILPIWVTVHKNELFVLCKAHESGKTHFL